MQKVSQIHSARRLIGARVLVVEDDLLISMDLAAGLTDAGAQVVGPCRTAKDAVAFVNEWNISVALLDIRLASESVVPVAIQLSDRRIPIVFYTVMSTQMKSEKNFRTARSFTSRLHPKSWLTQLPRY
jgi:DNA-binding response OmpR family regulator